MFGLKILTKKEYEKLKRDSEDRAVNKIISFLEKYSEKIIVSPKNFKECSFREKVYVFGNHITLAGCDFINGLQMGVDIESLEE